MSPLSLARRITNLFRRAKVDREIDNEIAAHIEMRMEDNIANGMSPQDARRNALLRFGNPTVMKERTVEADVTLYLESLWADMRYALRQLAKAPGFAVTAVLTLALGIGANLAVFQLLYGVLFAHLPVTQPEQLYVIHAAKTPFDGGWSISYPAYRRLRQATPSAAPIFAHGWIARGVLQESNGADTSTSRIDFQLISDNFFSVLNLSPYAGRFFLSGDDDHRQLEWPVILRYGFFQQHFSGNRSVLGKRAVVNGIPIVIVGIAPKDFSGVLQWNAPDLWLPLAAQTTGRVNASWDSLGPGSGVDLDRPWLNQPGIFWLWTLARVPDTVKPSIAALWTATLAPDLTVMASESKDPQERVRIQASQVQLVSAANGQGNLVRKYSLPLIILMAMAGVILLIGSLNLANLQMARLMQREREIAIRIALGASRIRVLRQVAIEAVVLAALGGALALITGRICSSLLLRWASGRDRIIPIELGMGEAAYVTGAMLLFAALVAFGLLPAWQITRKSFSTASSQSSRLSGQSKGQGKSGRRWSNLLLAGQVSFSLLLLSAAALFAQTLRNIGKIDAGMDHAHILSVHLDMHSTGFAEQQQDLPALYERILDQLTALPMVSDAAISWCDIPQCGWNTAFHVYGHPELLETQLHGEENHVGVGYFRTLGIPLIEGRDFTAQDTPASQRVAILNLSYARRLFGDATPIGRWIGYNAAPKDHELLIVGEVADARVDGLRLQAPAVAYLSNDQNPAPVGTIEVRVRGPVKSLSKDIRDALHNVEPALPITEIVPLDLELQDDLTSEVLLARLTTAFGALALTLAALGFYGLVSFRVARRISEIGLRMALGATRANVQALFLGQTIVILLAGVVPGIALTVGMFYAARKLIYGPESMSIWALAAATCVLTLVGIVATLHPARRAAMTDPMQTLRMD